VAAVERKTSETHIRLTLNLDGQGEARVNTGIGFFDHMLQALARHGLMDLEVTVEGDLHVDGHHTVEDTGICLGMALQQALGDKQGIRRIGSATVPMDEALVHATVDLSGRPFLNFQLRPEGHLIGAFDPSLTEEFSRALAFRAGMILHLLDWAGGNNYQRVEAAFEAVGRALGEATRRDERIAGVLSSSGVLE